MEQKKLFRPKSVNNALMLLYICIGIGAIRLFFFNTSSQIASIAPSLVWGFGIFILLVIWLFVFLIGQRQNWARIVFLVLFIIGIPMSISYGLADIAVNPSSGFFYILQTFLQLIAIILLFKKESSEWFSQQSVVVVNGNSEFTYRAEKHHTKRCPFCAEEIQYEAVFCKHCHKNIPWPATLNKIPNEKINYCSICNRLESNFEQGICSKCGHALSLIE